jgi:hypothetical protein
MHACVCTYLGANAVRIRRIPLLDHALNDARFVHGGRTTQRERKRVHRTDVTDEDVLNVGRLATHLWASEGRARKKCRATEQVDDIREIREDAESRDKTQRDKPRKQYEECC